MKKLSLLLSLVPSILLAQPSAPVQQIRAGDGITISPASGRGQVTINATVSGSGNVTNSGTLTNNAIATGAGTTVVKTPSATSTLDTSGNLVLAGSVTTGTGSGVGGTLTLTEGTPPSLTANAFSVYAPTDVAAGGLAYITPAAASTGLLLSTNAAGVMTLSHVATGTGVNTALGVNTGSAGAFQVNNASGAGLTALTAANISTGALADGMTATTQAASDNDTSLATTGFAYAAALAGMVSTYATPDTTGGAVTLTKAVTEVWTNTTTTYTIPAVASSTGKAIIFYVVGTNAITIDPNASEIIVRDGTAQTGGVTMTLTGVAGNYVCLICDGTRWVSLGYKGVLAAGS